VKVNRYSQTGKCIFETVGNLFSIRDHAEYGRNGGGIITVGVVATVDAEGADPREDKAYWAKFAADAERFGLTEAMGTYNTRLKIAVDKVWTTPTEA